MGEGGKESHRVGNLGGRRKQKQEHAKAAQAKVRKADSDFWHCEESEWVVREEDPATNPALI